jgi:hypothetical protein
LSRPGKCAIRKKRLNRRDRGARRDINDQRPRCKEKRGGISNAFRKPKTPEGLSEKDLCALCFLFVLPLVFIRGGSRERKSLIPQWRKEPQTAETREDAERMKYACNGFVFRLLEEKLCGLCVLGG